MFKAGDKVECVKSDGYVLEERKVYTVVGCLGHYVHVGTQPSDGWFLDRFVLAKPEAEPEAKSIPISDIPEGWEVVRIGVPKKGEWFFDAAYGQPMYCDSGAFRFPHIILRRADPVELGTLKAGDKFAFDDTAVREPGVQEVVDKRHVKDFGDEVCYFSPNSGFGSVCADVKVHPIGGKP